MTTTGAPKLADMPTLDALIADPGLVRDLPAPVVHHLLVQVTSLLPLLLAHAHGPLATEKISQEDRLLTVAEVADRLSVPKSYAYELVRQQKLPAVRLGKYVRVAQETLAKYIAMAASSAP